MKRQKRKLNRLKDYDYSTCGYYYVTICIRDKVSVFGEIKNETMVLNHFGKIAGRRWREIPEHYENVGIDSYVIMPNHIHGIIIIKPYDNNTSVGTEQCSVPTVIGKKSSSKKYGLLSKIIKSFKNTVIKDVREIDPDFDFGWQRSFYDHIIRKDDVLTEIRKYIAENPLKWYLDQYNREK